MDRDALDSALAPRAASAAAAGAAAAGAAGAAGGGPWRPPRPGSGGGGWPSSSASAGPAVPWPTEPEEAAADPAALVAPPAASPPAAVSPSPSTASSSAAAAFPPALAEAEELLPAPAGEGEDAVVAAERRLLALQNWRGALLEVLEGVARGAGAEAPPVEEVWHWLAASERLERCLVFCEHRVVVSVLAAAAADVERGAAEGAEIVEKWHGSLRQLRRSQRESSWNASYLRVVEGPLRRLTSDDVVRSGSLPSTVATLLRALRKIYCTSAYFKEQRMVTLLQKVLKALVSQASRHLPSPHEVARPEGGLGAAMLTAEQMRDGFQAFSSNNFVTEAMAGACGTVQDGRPTTALGTSGDSRCTAGVLASARRREAKDSADLGWWRATARWSREHAVHCQAACGQLVGLLRQSARLVAALPALQTADPELLREAESFVELHSGTRSGCSAAELLDPKRLFQASVQVQDVEERLNNLLARIEARGLAPLLDDSAFTADSPTLLDAESSLAEVLVLPCGRADGSAAASVAQENIDCIEAELRRFGSQLKNRVDTLRVRKTAAGGGAVGPDRHFSPPPRGAGPEDSQARAAALEPAADDASAAASPEADAGAADEEEEADRVAALEVARRASWYKEPPPLLPSDVPVIEVRHAIVQRPLRRCLSRPRTAQPTLFVTRPRAEPEGGRRPATASPADLLGGGPGAPPEPGEPEAAEDAEQPAPAAGRGGGSSSQSGPEAGEAAQPAAIGVEGESAEGGFGGSLEATSAGRQEAEAPTLERGVDGRAVMDPGGAEEIGVVGLEGATACSDEDAAGVAIAVPWRIS